jgi:hypothetical protein
MNYTVKVNIGNKRRIITQNPRIISSIDVSSGAQALSSFSDVDISNRKDGYVLMWNSILGVHQYVPPFDVVDRSDSDNPVLDGDGAIDYGTF